MNKPWWSTEAGHSGDTGHCLLLEGPKRHTWNPHMVASLRIAWGGEEDLAAGFPCPPGHCKLPNSWTQALQNPMAGWTLKHPTLPHSWTDLLNTTLFWCLWLGDCKKAMRKICFILVFTLKKPNIFPSCKVPHWYRLHCWSNVGAACILSTLLCFTCIHLFFWELTCNYDQKLLVVTITVTFQFTQSGPLALEVKSPAVAPSHMSVTIMG